MSTGPSLLFDKSTLQSLRVDESVWLEQFFFANITPLFFAEALADIEKAVADGRTPEDVVGNLAEKTPTGGLPNVYHHTLCMHELLFGARIDMSRRVIVGGGKQFNEAGKRGIVMEQSAEVTALHRWRDGKFLDVERAFARRWRAGLSILNLDGVYQYGRALVHRMGRPGDLAAARAMAVTILEKRGSRATRDALERFVAPADVRRAIVERWVQQGTPPISVMAPYTAHVFTVDLFFSIALGAELIGRERTTNKLDIGYLYYLPFCEVFASSDTLHRKTAPLFMMAKQEFVWGLDLKTDLAVLDAHYKAIPEVNARGVMATVHYPPVDVDCLVARLWDRLRPGWREAATRPPTPMAPEAEQKLIAHLNRMARAARVPAGTEAFGSKEADAVLLEHKVPLRKGSWRLLPPEVEADA